jgi:hypothetical protein
MADWLKINRACTTLWTTLYNMKQLSANFDDSGKLQIKDLMFYNMLASAELRKQQATIIADQLDNVFRIGRGATYENNVDRTSAMQNMVGILIDESKTVNDLASTVDNCYEFWGE